MDILDISIEKEFHEWKKLKTIPEIKKFWYKVTYNKLKNKKLINLYQHLQEKIDYKLILETNNSDKNWNGLKISNIEKSYNNTLETLSDIFKNIENDENFLVTSGGFIGYSIKKNNIIGIGWFGNDYNKLCNINNIKEYKKYPCNFYLFLRKYKLDKLKNLK